MMKRVIAVILCLSLMLSLPALGLAGSSAAVVSNPDPKDRLHLRAQPSASAASLGKYYNGTPVTVLEYLKGGWAKVTVGEPGYALEGYMMRKYLAAGAAAAKVKSAMPEYMSTSSGWDLYRSPEEDADRDIYGYGEAVRLMGFTPDWWHVAVMRDGKIHKMGFVPAQSLKAPPTAVVCNPNPKDRLHLRMDHSTTAASLGKYYNGTKVLVLSYHVDGTWAKVRIDKTEGFMLAEYLKLSKDAGKVKNAMPTLRVTASRATLRAQASDRGASLGSFYRGASVKVWGICGAWLHVQAGGKIGYMKAAQVSKVPE